MLAGGTRRSREQPMKANVERAPACRGGPWPRTLRFPASLNQRAPRLVPSASSAKYETLPPRTAQLRQEQLQHGGAVEISFVINYCADYGQQVVLVGSSQELGSWDTAAAVRLAWQQGDNWKATVQLPAPERGAVQLQYKYAVISDSDSADLWQEGPNISLVLSPEPTANPTAQPPSLKVFDSWLQPQHSQHVLAVQVAQSQAPSAADPATVLKEQHHQQQQQLPVQQAPAASTKPPAAEQRELPSQRTKQHEELLPPQQRPLQQQVQMPPRQHQLVYAFSSSSSSSSSRSGSSSSSMGRSGGDSRAGAATWADAGSLLVTAAAAASTAAAAAGTSLAAAASEAAATAAKSKLAGSKSAEGISPSRCNPTNDTASAAAAAGNAVAQLLTAVAAGVVTLREGAAISSQASSSSSSSSSSHLLGIAAASLSRTSEAAVSQASTAIANGWRGLLAAAANVPRHVKPSARRNSHPSKGAAAASAAVPAGRDTALAGASAAGTSATAIEPMPAVPAGNGSSRLNVQDHLQAAPGAVADQAGMVAADVQQQKQKQQVSVEAQAGWRQAHVQEPLTWNAAEQQRKPQEQQVVANAVAAEQTEAHVLPNVAAANKQQQQQHMVLDDALDMPTLQQQSAACTGATGADHQHQQGDLQHRLAASAMASDKCCEQQQLLAQVMNALEHSASLRQECGDPCDPGLLAADRRLAAATDVFRGLVNSPQPDDLQQQQQQQEVLQEVAV